MRGGAAAAQIVVVHAGQVVMHQRIGVENFDRSPDARGARRIDVEQLGGIQHQERTQPFAAGEGRVAHGFVDARMQAVRLGQDAFQRLVHRAGGSRQGLRQSCTHGAGRRLRHPA